MKLSGKFRIENLITSIFFCQPGYVMNKKIDLIRNCHDDDAVLKLERIIFLTALLYE